MKNKIVLVITLLFFSVSPAFGHGNHFHSLSEMADHIDRHIDSLENLLSKAHPSNVQIEQQRQEILEHTAMYQELASAMAGKNENSRTAKLLNRMSKKLAMAMQHEKLNEGLGILKEMQTLLMPYRA